MKLIFAGTPLFASVALDALLSAGHEISLVLTQPDRHAGRGMKLAPSPVKRLAERHGLPTLQPLSLKRDYEARAAISAVGADVMIVVAYGLILPPDVLAAPRLGCLNIHASLLPRWRGAAPIQRAIEAGDIKTGISIMQMEAGLDTGPVLARACADILPDDTASVLHDRLALLGANLLCDTLLRLPLSGEVQNEAEATYAARIEREETLLDWRLDAELLARRVRAFNPARTLLLGDTFKIWAAYPVIMPNAAPPGVVLAADDRGIAVSCGRGDVLMLTELQKPGGRRLFAAEFLRGAPEFQTGQFLRSFVSG
ncbi:MAG: methionyl-tRNA formyltransferase [Betaproteobacteria bacterium]|nr:methionyl-tRNA formyltransferase [Betaproteobacteria bacterium]